MTPPDAASASARRCGQSTSTGGTATKSGPGKSPGLPIAACSTASSAASVASLSPRVGAQNGSAATKSTVPAIRVRRPAVGKRVMAWMPERPAVRPAQFAALPCPSDVTMPRPVTATSGRPRASLSRVVVMTGF